MKNIINVQIFRPELPEWLDYSVDVQLQSAIDHCKSESIRLPGYKFRIISRQIETRDAVLAEFP